MTSMSIFDINKMTKTTHWTDSLSLLMASPVSLFLLFTAQQIYFWLLIKSHEPESTFGPFWDTVQSTPWEPHPASCSSVCLHIVQPVRKKRKIVYRAGYVIKRTSTVGWLNGIRGTWRLLVLSSSTSCFPWSCCLACRAARTTSVSPFEESHFGGVAAPSGFPTAGF